MRYFNQSVKELALQEISEMRPSQVEQRVSNLAFTNLSSYMPNHHENVVMGLGMKYIPTPLPATDGNLILEFKEFARTLRIKDFFSNKKVDAEDYNPKFHVSSNWIPKAKDISPPLGNALNLMDTYFSRMLAASRHSRTTNNLSKEQRTAIKSLKALRALKENSSIEMRMADKNLGSCLLDREIFMHILTRNFTSLSDVGLKLYESLRRKLG